MCDMFICVGLHGYCSDLHGEMRKFVKASISVKHGTKYFFCYLFTCVNMDSYEETQCMLLVITLNSGYAHCVPFFSKTAIFPATQKIFAVSRIAFSKREKSK